MENTLTTLRRRGNGKRDSFFRAWAKSLMGFAKLDKLHCGLSSSSSSAANHRSHPKSSSLLVSRLFLFFKNLDFFLFKDEFPECWTMATRAALNSQTLEEFVQRAGRSSPPSTSTTKTPEDTILERIDEAEHLHNEEETEAKEETRSQGSKKSGKLAPYSFYRKGRRGLVVPSLLIRPCAKE